MEVAAVVLGVGTTLDLCFKYGKILVDTCAAFRNADAQISERVLRIESHWKRTTMQLDVIKQIWSTLDEEHQAIQDRILQVLIRKLNDIISKIDGLLKKKKPPNRTAEYQIREIKRLKYIRTKKCLDESIEDLSLWQKQFDPSWFLMLKVSSPFIDQELNKRQSTTFPLANAHSLRVALKDTPAHKTSIFLPREGLDTARTRLILHTSTRCVPRTGSNKWFVLDCFPCPQVDRDQATKDVRGLARKLSSVEPYTFSILRCRGVIRNIELNIGTLTSFDFVFEIPQELGDEPKSLRSHLCSQSNITLTKRLEVAKQIAKSISYVHTLDFVHKNVRPETIIGFHPPGSTTDSFFLLGFQEFRSSDGRTLRAGDSIWQKNLYRHPHRHGLNPHDVYTMQHDIYSLGVCLLEIGLWESFVFYGEDTTSALPTATLGIDMAAREFERPILMKDHLVSLAKREIPTRMGERYMNIIVNCLTCLDENNVDFGCQSEFEDADGVLVGVRYIEKILLKLDEIII